MKIIELVQPFLDKKNTKIVISKKSWNNSIKETPICKYDSFAGGFRLSNSISILLNNNTILFGCYDKNCKKYFEYSENFILNEIKDKNIYWKYVGKIDGM